MCGRGRRAEGCGMVERGNELQRDRFDVPRGYSNIKGIGERCVTLRRAGGRVRRTKLRENRFKVCVEVVSGFLRVVPGLVGQWRNGGRTTPFAQRGRGRVSRGAYRFRNISSRRVKGLAQAVQGMENWGRRLLPVQMVEG